MDERKWYPGESFGSLICHLRLFLSADDMCPNMTHRYCASLVLLLSLVQRYGFQSEPPQRAFESSYDSLYCPNSHDLVSCSRLQRCAINKTMISRKQAKSTLILNALCQILPCLSPCRPLGCHSAPQLHTPPLQSYGTCRPLRARHGRVQHRA